MVGHSLMDGTHQMRRRSVVDLETKSSLGISLRAAGFFHALSQLEQHDFVASSGLVRCTVLYSAGKGFSRTESGRKQQGKKDGCLPAQESCCRKLQILAPFSLRIG